MRLLKTVLNFFYDKILHVQKAPKVPKDSFKLFIYFFFHGKILHAEKAQKEFTAPKSTKSTKIQPSKSKKRK